MGPSHDSEMVTLSRQECLARLASMPLGRVGVSIDALPVILPVHFTLVDEAILFRTTKGSKLDNAVSGAVVAFQADDRDAVEGGWWSVLLQGIATPVTDHDAQVDPGGTLSATDWAGVGTESRLLRVDTGTINGRLFLTT